MSFTTLDSAAPKGAAPAAPPPCNSSAGHLGLLCVTEPLDLTGAEQLSERIQRLSMNCRCVVLDLSAAEFLDSDGVRALLQLSREMQTADRELRLVLQPGSPVERIFNLLRLGQCLRAYSSLEEARTGQVCPS